MRPILLDGDEKLLPLLLTRPNRNELFQVCECVDAGEPSAIVSRTTPLHSLCSAGLFFI